MAPLIPDILSPEFGFVVAFLVGIGFGYALEQAGFSSTRKLVGLFYGYDFTVLKVFFTAGVTALTGVIILGHLGQLDLSRMYVNPMFLQSALIGGAIMGAGFIMGGFCPGTSICAASVGRLDAFAFIGGSIIGILVFMEGFNVVEPIYRAGSMGALRIDQWLGVSPEVFGIILAAIALIAFYFTSKIEDKVRGKSFVLNPVNRRKYILLSATPFALLLVVLLTPSKQELMLNRVDAAMHLSNQELDLEEVDIDELAFELVHNAHKYNVIDVRDTSDYKVTVPTAINIPISEIADQAWIQVYRQNYKQNVFVADDIQIAKKAALIVREMGDEDPVVLTNGVMEFRNVVFKATDPGLNAPKILVERYKFYKTASIQLKKLEEKLKQMRQPVKKKEIVVKGGCS